jgi:hypothetical protein
MSTNIKEIIDELETIADAFTSVNTFNFGKVSEINDQPEKSYPAIYINSVIEGRTIERDSNSHLPKIKSYPIEIIFWDLYLTAEQATTDIQSKYSALEIIADKYFAEVNRRTIEDPASTRQFYIDNFEDLTGTYVTHEHTDDLVGIRYRPIFKADNIACNTGTFNY